TARRVLQPHRGYRNVRRVGLVSSSELGRQIEGAHGGGAECAEAFGLVVPAEDFDGGDTDRARHLQGFGARHKLVSIAGAEKIHLQFTGNPDPSLGKTRSDGDAGCLIGKRGDHPAMEMAEELQEIVAARERELRSPWLDREDAEAGGAGKTLGVDGFGKARWIEGVVHVSIRCMMGTARDAPLPTSRSQHVSGV